MTKTNGLLCAGLFGWDFLFLHSSRRGLAVVLCLKVAPRMWDFLSPSLTSEDSTRICATKEMGLLGWERPLLT